MTLRRILWALVAIGACAGLLGAARRFSVEMRNRAVEIAVDLGEVREVALGQGVPLSTALERLRAAGATSVLIAEDTLGSLEAQRRVEVVATARPGHTHLFVHQGLYGRVRDHLRQRTRVNPILPKGLETGEAREAGIEIDAPWSLLEGQGVGVDPAEVETVRAAGLGVVGRVGAGLNASPENIRWTLTQLHGLGVRTVIFTGDSVLGFPKRLKDTAEALRDPSIDLAYGAVEFGKQRGDAGLARLAPDRVVRVHAITAAEMATATVPDSVQRFSLAARERNIRLLFVRLFTDAAEPLDAGADYVAAIRGALGRGGLGAGVAHPYDPLETSVILRLLLGLGAGAGVVLLLDAIAGVLTGAAALAGLVPLAFAALAALPMPIGAKLVALAAGCAFPSLGLVRADLGAPGKADPATVARRFLTPTLITFLGVAHVVGLLADRAYLVKADAFAGVKLTLVVPLLAAVCAYGLGLRAPTLAAFRARLAELAARVRDAMFSPILVWQVAAGAAALALVAMLVLRSGNDPGIGVSETELKVRALLDRLLVTRPRFKDILGHPALLVGIVLAAQGRRAWAVPLLLLGVVGQASLLNTFCHLHTPLWISFARDLIGLAIGAAIGAGLLWVRVWWLRRGRDGA